MSPADRVPVATLNTWKCDGDYHARMALMARMARLVPRTPHHSRGRVPFHLGLAHHFRPRQFSISKANNSP